MKIIYVFFHSNSDMPYHTREWVEAAIALGHEITVITSIDSEFLIKIGWEGKVNVKQVEYPGKGFLNYLKLLKGFRTAIDKELNKEGNYSLLYERFSNISVATAYCASKNKTLYAIEVNGIIDEELKLSKTSSARRLFFKIIQSYVYKRADAIITVTDQIKKWIVEKNKVSEKIIKTINNGVNTDRFKPLGSDESRTRFNFPKNKFIVGYLGSLYPWYDLEVIIRTSHDIIQKIPEVLFVIGGGQEPIKSELEKLVNRSNLNKYIYFSGQIPWDEAAAFTSTFDVAIAPTRFADILYEVSPLKLASYMACAIPVIGSNTPGMQKIIEEVECGLVYIDDKSFAKCLFSIYSLSYEKRKEMGRRGRTFIEKNLTWKAQVTKTIDFIKDIHK